MRIHEFGNPDAPVVLIEPIHTVEGMAHEAELLRELAGDRFLLRAAEVDWFRDLSPWKAPAVFGDEAFGDGAPETLREILKLTGDPEKRYMLGGYSLGGLFALWAAYRTDAFSGIAAVSPSAWFPGFAEFTASRRPMTGRIYLSLGDREEKTRNPAMASVGDRIRELHSLLQAQGIPCCLEWNEGNHFRDPDLRTAKGFAWLLNHTEKLSAL